MAARLNVAVRIGHEQCEQALVVCPASQAAVEMRAHARDQRVSGAAGELKLHVAVERVEALIAVELRPGRSRETPYQELGAVAVVVGYGASPPRFSSMVSPRAASSALSFCRASCSVL
jgi:hypothetical protein